MRKIDIIANEKFSGNVEKTIEYLLYNAGENAFDEYIDELTQDEARIAVKFLEKEAVKQYGGKKEYNAEIKKNRKLYSLNLTEEEVKNAKINLYKADILKGVFKLLVMESGVVALSMVGNGVGINPMLIGTIGSTITALASSTLATNIINYVKFKKVQKMVANSPVAEELENGITKRGM